jgi:hypothetical protein
MAAASAAVSVVVAPLPCRTGPNAFDPAEMVTTLVPALRMRLSIDQRAPLPFALHCGEERRRRCSV